MIFDTHAHYDDSAFDEDRSKILSSLKEQGVEVIVNVGAELAGCQKTIELTEKYPFVYGALGIHPDGISVLTEDDITSLRDECIRRSIKSGGKIVAVGEIGLDYYYPEPEPVLQKKWFARQLELAHEVNLPVIIHSRDAAQDTYDIMKEHNAEKIGGIVHCYSYSKQMAERFLDMGFYFGVGGVITFKNARKLVETVEYLPLDSIVLETDCPYLAPVPKRGTRNDSTNLIFVAEKIAEIKGIPTEEVIRITNINAKKVYGINGNT